MEFTSILGLGSLRNIAYDEHTFGREPTFEELRSACRDDYLKPGSLRNNDYDEHTSGAGDDVQTITFGLRCEYLRPV